MTLIGQLDMYQARQITLIGESLRPGDWLINRLYRERKIWRLESRLTSPLLIFLCSTLVNSQRVSMVGNNVILAVFSCLSLSSALRYGGTLGLIYFRLSVCRSPSVHDHTRQISVNDFSLIMQFRIVKLGM